MSEVATPEIKTIWRPFTGRPNVVDAVQYQVFTKDNREYSNFLHIIKRPHVNGRVWQPANSNKLNVQSNSGRLSVSTSDWIVMTPLNDFLVYKDADFKKLYGEGEVSTNAIDNSLHDIVENHTQLLSKLNDSISSLETAFAEAKAVAACGPDESTDLSEAPKTKGAKNVKS